MDYYDNAFTGDAATFFLGAGFRRVADTMEYRQDKPCSKNGWFEFFRKHK